MEAHGHCPPRFIGFQLSVAFCALYSFKMSAFDMAKLSTDVLQIQPEVLCDDPVAPNQAEIVTIIPSAPPFSIESITPIWGRQTMGRKVRTSSTKPVTTKPSYNVSPTQMTSFVPNPHTSITDTILVSLQEHPYIISACAISFYIGVIVGIIVAD